MGVTITAYKGPIKRHTNQRDTSKGTRFYDNDHFEGRALPFKSGYHNVDAETAVEVFDGGYGTYSEYRTQLAKLAGFATVAQAWAAAREEGAEFPFMEQIWFSDAEGVLGTAVCQKLSKDYKTFTVAAEAEGGEFYEIFLAFKKGFKLAGESGGAVNYS